MGSPSDALVHQGTHSQTFALQLPTRGLIIMIKILMTIMIIMALAVVIMFIIVRTQVTHLSSGQCPLHYIHSKTRSLMIMAIIILMISIITAHHHHHYGGHQVMPWATHSKPPPDIQVTASYQETAGVWARKLLASNDRLKAAVFSNGLELNFRNKKNFFNQVTEIHKLL